jgi:antitoxin (DNA-binding transcriptional repressor) of toxin-antitoxin stability system
MARVSIRDLRNHGGDIVDRAARGEKITVTRSGRAVAVAGGCAASAVGGDSAESLAPTTGRGPRRPAGRYRRASGRGPVSEESRKASARAYDAMIAATAFANDLPVYTCNPDDFEGIEGLEIVAVPVPPPS